MGTSTWTWTWISDLDLVARHVVTRVSRWIGAVSQLPIIECVSLGPTAVMSRPLQWLTRHSQVG